MKPSTGTVQRAPGDAPSGAEANWSWALPLAALLLVGEAALPTALARGWVPTCIFRRATGWPCPTCGGTRSLLALRCGQARSAIAYNPLVSLTAFTVAAAGLLGAAERLARRPLLTRVARRVRQVPVKFAVGLVLANWTYLLWRR